MSNQYYVYDGGGTANALQTTADEDALVALGTAPAIIQNVSSNTLRVWLMNTTASQSCTLCAVCKDSSGNVVEVVETAFVTTDQTFETDQDRWDLTTGTVKAAKAPTSITVPPGSNIQLTVSATLGGVWYAAYLLKNK